MVKHSLLARQSLCITPKKQPIVRQFGREPDRTGTALLRIAGEIRNLRVIVIPLTDGAILYVSGTMIKKKEVMTW
jgi:hypothetical protein